MISPSEAVPFYLATLPTVRLLALVAFVNRDGDLEYRDGYAGEIIDCLATSMSEGAVWVPLDGTYAGEVLQAFPRGNNLLSFPGRIRQNGRSLEDVTLVVAAFSGGATSAVRAMKQATARVLPELEAFHVLILMSDATLEHAIGTNLRDGVSAAAHTQNVAELEALVRSGSELVDEIRTFLEKMRSSRDKGKRHNVWRMVLIVRAVQRRAQKVGEAKGATLEAVTTIGLDLARYNGAVMALAGRIATELNDPQPWWTGQDGALSRRAAERRRQNFIDRLDRFATDLASVTARPFRHWAFVAREELRTMVSVMRMGQYATIHRLTSQAVAALRTMLLREQVSRAIMATRREDLSERAFVDDTFSAAQAWARDPAPTLGIAPRTVSIFDVAMRMNAAPTWTDHRNALRVIERTIDEIV